jgi:hypothetical protein
MMSWPGWAAERQAWRGDEAARRLRAVGPNALRSHRVHALSVLASQVRTPLLSFHLQRAARPAAAARGGPAYPAGTCLGHDDSLARSAR